MTPYARRVAGESVASIARVLDLSIATVRQLLTDRAYAATLEANYERDAAIARLHADRLASRDIALHLGISRNTVNNRLRAIALADSGASARSVADVPGALAAPR